ncbi:hypothetical protein CXB51_014675 [Gossypium anomalum]|uniref:CCHC-type domain-containing protein n=1 Tax=Gossypium anomalum TaxID=47600 RepID=A0A8J6D0M2_9ROSI|nr:hypothetical protein CXB51_014675 [Gossypium anomalum]
MENTVVVKLLGRNIGYAVLHNHISSLWRPSQPFHLMDVENGYYLAFPYYGFDLDLVSWNAGFLYKQRVFEEIGSLVGKAARLDIKTYSGTKGHFARMAVYVDLKKSFISQILINGRIQRVEFGAFPVACFVCGCYGHLKNLCPLSLQISALRMVM